MTVESNDEIAIPTLSEWLKRPMRSKTKTNMKLVRKFQGALALLCKLRHFVTNDFLVQSVLYYSLVYHFLTCGLTAWETLLPQLLNLL